MYNKIIKEETVYPKGNSKISEKIKETLGRDYIFGLFDIDTLGHDNIISLEKALVKDDNTKHVLVNIRTNLDSVVLTDYDEFMSVMELLESKEDITEEQLNIKIENIFDYDIHKKKQILMESISSNQITLVLDIDDKFTIK